MRFVAITFQFVYTGTTIRPHTLTNGSEEQQAVTIRILLLIQNQWKRYHLTRHLDQCNIVCISIQKHR